MQYLIIFLSFTFSSFVRFSLYFRLLKRVYHLLSEISLNFNLPRRKAVGLHVRRCVLDRCQVFQRLSLNAPRQFRA